MKILLTGKNGQVGWELQRTLAPLGELIACDRVALDLAKPDQIVSVIRAVKPDIIVNAAAYTAVDKAESEPELALAINAIAPGIFAEEAKRLGALLVHYSTDYVFDGTKAGRYTEDDAPNPLNVYGRTKLGGEQAVVASGALHFIFRTGWVYGARGRNFLLRIRSLAREGSQVRVVADQTGAPTSSITIASATHQVLGTLAIGTNTRRLEIQSGIFHMTAEGKATWYEFAKAGIEDLVPRAELIPTSSEDYPSTAARPRNSLLSNEKLQRAFGITLPHWLEGLKSVLSQIRKETEISPARRD